MAGRRLSLDESMIWAKVAATVRRLEPGALSPHRHPELDSISAGRPIPAESEQRRVLNRNQQGERIVPQKPPGDHLDGGWDRRLRRGVVEPERTIDLHGHTLASAHAALDHALDRAVTEGVRVLLIVTGKPPRDPAPHRRGLIRAAIGDWLAGSRHAGRIAAIRNAHPRHGGAGALYLILRRVRIG